MFLQPNFTETDPETIKGLIEHFPLATLIVHSTEGLIANHIPMLLVGADKLIGHIALENDLHRLVENECEALVIFRGDDAYISANWYPEKAEHHKVVPTWNYQVVHIHGTLSFQFDQKSKAIAVGKLTTMSEGKTNGDQAWRMSDAPRDFIQSELNGIVALSIEIKQVVGKSKLSQNKPLEDAQNVARMLRQKGDEALATQMDAKIKLRP